MYQNQTYLLLRKTPRVMIRWLSFLVICSVFTIILLCYPYSPVFSYDGFVVLEDQEYYVKIYSRENEVGKLNNQEVIINGQSYSLTYIKIKEALTVQNDLEVYHEVYLKTRLKKSLRVHNNKVEVQFTLPKTTLFQQGIKEIKRVVYEGINKV